MVMVFDCETIPDVTLIKQGFKKEFEALNFDFSDELAISKKAMEIQKENSGSEFLPICYHQVVSIAAIFAMNMVILKK